MSDPNSSANWASANLLTQLAERNERAAEVVFCRYFARLAALARGRLSTKLQRRVEPDDVALSAFRSFFVGAQKEQFLWARAGDLWRILATITVRKSLHAIRTHSAAARDVQRESPGQHEFLSIEPSPAEAVAISDTLEHAMAKLTPVSRQIVSLRLQGWSHEEIANEVVRTERTVRRAIEEFRHLIRDEAPDG